MLKRNDKVFGELEFDFVWQGETIFGFMGKEYKTVLSVSGEEDELFEDGQYEAYKLLKSKLTDEFYLEILGNILKYYQEQREELGYDEETNDEYPEIETVDVLLNHLELSGITVLYTGENEEHCIGLTFDCTWDEENGVGVYFVNEEIEEIGYQDVVM